MRKVARIEAKSNLGIKGRRMCEDCGRDFVPRVCFVYKCEDEFGLNWKSQAVSGTVRYGCPYCKADNYRKGMRR